MFNADRLDEEFLYARKVSQFATSFARALALGFDFFHDSREFRIVRDMLKVNAEACSLLLDLTDVDLRFAFRDRKHALEQSLPSATDPCSIESPRVAYFDVTVQARKPRAKFCALLWRPPHCRKHCLDRHDATSSNGMRI